MIGTTELVIILVIVGLLFGASAIPRLAKSIGQARKEFEKGMGSAGGAKEVTSSSEKTTKESSLSSEESNTR